MLWFGISPGGVLSDEKPHVHIRKTGSHYERTLHSACPQGDVMKSSTTYLTIIYWLADILLSVWLGGLVLAYLVLGGLVPEAIPPLLHGLAKLILPMAIVLGTSTILIAVLGHRDRNSFGWWLVWLIRTTAAFCLIGFAIWGASKVDNDLEDLETAISQNAADQQLVRPSSVPPVTPPDTLTESSESVVDVPAPALTGMVEAKSKFVGTYNFWMGLQFALGVVVFFTAAFRQAAWRQSWVDDRKGQKDELDEDEPEEEDSDDDKPDGVEPPTVSQDDSQTDSSPEKPEATS